MIKKLILLAPRVPPLGQYPNASNVEAALAAEEASLRQTGEKVDQFNTSQRNATDGIDRSLEALEKALDKVQINISGNQVNYQPGSFFNSDEGKSLNKAMLESTRHIVQDGTMRDAVKAIGIRGGYIAYLTGIQRSLLENMKGKNVTSA